MWFAISLPSHTVLLDSALATMVGGLFSAMEAARLYPECRVIAICGDGGFMMNSQELETAVRIKLYMIVLILDDSSCRMILWKQYAMGYKDFGLEFKIQTLLCMKISTVQKITE